MQIFMIERRNFKCNDLPEKFIDTHKEQTLDYYKDTKILEFVIEYLHTEEGTFGLRYDNDLRDFLHDKISRWYLNYNKLEDFARRLDKLNNIIINKLENQDY